MVDDARLDSVVAFNPEHHGYIINIFEYTYDSRFHIWATQKYKEFIKFIRKLFACDKDFMQPDEIITYVSLVQEDMREYSNFLLKAVGTHW